MRPKQANARQRQAGMTLLVGMIMLLLITLLAVSAMRLATTGLQVVGNEQFHDESVSAANFVLDQVLTDKDFISNYSAAAGKTFAAVNVGQASYRVVVPKIACKRTRVITSQDLVTKVTVAGGAVVDTVLPADLPCIGGQGSGGVVIAGGSTGGTASGASLCSTVLWDVEAQVTGDSATGAKAIVHQGIEVRVDSSDVTNNCK